MEENKEAVKAAITGIKRQFMAYRNGIIADSMRKAGYPYSVIFGLNVPQIAHIARTLTDGESLAPELWRDKGVRESRIMACYLFPHDITKEEAQKLINDLQTPEEGDMLAFRLLKHLPYAPELVDENKDSANAMCRHLAEILSKHISG